MTSPVRFMVFTPGSREPPRGPWTLDEVRRRLASRELQANAKLCVVGEEEWRDLQDVLPDLTEEKVWFVYADGLEEPIGPVSLDLIRRGLAHGKVPRDAIAAREHDPEWLPVERVIEDAFRAEAPTEDLDLDDDAATMFLNRDTVQRALAPKPLGLPPSRAVSPPAGPRPPGPVESTRPAPAGGAALPRPGPPPPRGRKAPLPVLLGGLAAVGIGTAALIGYLSRSAPATAVEVASTAGAPTPAPTPSPSPTLAEREPPPPTLCEAPNPWLDELDAAAADAVAVRPRYAQKNRAANGPLEMIKVSGAMRKETAQRAEDLRRRQRALEALDRAPHEGPIVKDVAGAYDVLAFSFESYSAAFKDGTKGFERLLGIEEMAQNLPPLMKRLRREVATKCNPAANTSTSPLVMGACTPCATQEDFDAVMKAGSKCCPGNACSSDRECPGARVCCKIPGGQLCGDASRCTGSNRVEGRKAPSTPKLDPMVCTDFCVRQCRVSPENDVDPDEFQRENDRCIDACVKRMGCE